MVIANLQRYDIEEGVFPHNHYGKIVPDADGEFCKFEEAMEASSNILQQLKECHSLLCLASQLLELHCPNHVLVERIDKFLATASV